MGVVPPIDISTEQHKTILMLLQRYLPETTAWVYGSRAKWTSRHDSDLDLVVFAKPGQYNQVGELREAFEESNLPFRVDLFVWDDVPDSFRKNIREQHIELTLGHEEISDPITAIWPLATVEEISEKVAMGPFGSSIKVETFVPEGIPVISGQHLHSTRVDDSPGHKFITEEHAKRLANANVQRGDIIFTHAGNIGQVAYIPENSRYERYIISQRQFYARCNPVKAIPEFITYYFKSREGQHKLLANASQVGVPSIAQPVTYLRTIEIPLPLLSEQRPIAHILGTLDDKIELNRRMNETLEAMTRAIFEDWFVDFGPTRAKMEGREPYLSSEIWDLFPDALDDEGKPGGSEMRRLEGILELVYGKSLPAKNRMPGNVSVYGSGGVIGTHNIALIDGPAVIVGRKGTVGALYWEDGPAFPIDTVFYVIPRIGSLLFSYHMLAFQPLRDMNTDAAVPGLNRNNVYRLEFALPSFTLASAFEELVGPIWERRSQNLKEMQILKKIRDLLLPKLISGEIRLTEAEEAIETAI